MRNAAVARIVLAMVWLLTGASTPGPAIAGEAPVALTRAATSEESSRAVAYWRLWLTLRARARDASVPLQERIDVVSAFLANSPADAWADVPRSQAAQTLAGLHQQAFAAAESAGAPAAAEARTQAPPASPGPGEAAASPASPEAPAFPVVGASREHASPAHSGWDVVRLEPETSVLLFDVASLAYSAPIGFDVGLVRLRWSTFQLQVAAGGFDINALLANYRFWAGLIGLGARFPFGEGRRHEIGLLVFPLSVDVYQMPGADYEWERRQGFGLFHSRLYYRYDFDYAALEAGLATPLVYGCDDVYDSAPPLMLTFGVAFGRTHAARE